MTEISILFFGLLMGMRHATEPDHLAAVLTLSSKHNSLTQSIWHGMAWGAGHTLTLGLVGGIVMALGKTIPIHLAQYLEMIVGVMLILLSLDVLRRLFNNEARLAKTQNISDQLNAGIKDSSAAFLLSSVIGRISPRALLIGMVHGLAGSAALVILSLHQAGSVGLGFVYILIFGIGSVLGMGVLSLVIAVPVYLSSRWNYTYNGLIGISGLISFGMGISIIYNMTSGL